MKVYIAMYGDIILAAKTSLKGAKKVCFMDYNTFRDIKEKMIWKRDLSNMYSAYVNDKYIGYTVERIEVTK